MILERVRAFLVATEFSWWDVLDILIVAFIIYELLQFIRGTHAVQMALGALQRRADGAEILRRRTGHGDLGVDVGRRWRRALDGEVEQRAEPAKRQQRTGTHGHHAV